MLLKEERFCRLNIIQGDISLKLEWVNDVPARVGEPTPHPVLGRLDTAENILANNITALMDREEPKDLADIWGFCCIMGLSIQDAIKNADSKAAGVFPYDSHRYGGLEDPNATRYAEQGFVSLEKLIEQGKYPMVVGEFGGVWYSGSPLMQAEEDINYMKRVLMLVNENPGKVHYTAFGLDPYDATGIFFPPNYNRLLPRGELILQDMRDFPPTDFLN